MRHIVLLLLCFLSSAASAQITKWVDANGKVHYSDQPPATNVATEKLNIKSNPKPAGESNQPAAAKSYIEKDQEYRKRRVEQEESKVKQEKELAESLKKKENCISARNSLQSLQDGARSYSYTEKGERVVMDDSGREKAINEAKKSVETWCK